MARKFLISLLLDHGLNVNSRKGFDAAYRVPDNVDHVVSHFFRFLFDFNVYKHEHSALDFDVRVTGS